MNNLMTVQQLKMACDKHSFILARLKSNKLMGINTKIANIALKRKYYKPDSLTMFTGIIPCDFHTYISFKHPFISSK